jgi:hypothetical protein
MLEALKKISWTAEPVQGPQDWQRVRRAECVRDRALTGTTRRWLQRLPARRRPYRLCTAFPRVANRLAWVWADEAMAAQVLDDLLVDRRGGRSGFPHWVTRELRRLQEFNDQHRKELRPEGFLEAAGRVLGNL